VEQSYIYLLPCAPLEWISWVASQHPVWVRGMPRAGWEHTSMHWHQYMMVAAASSWLLAHLAL